MPRQLTTLSGLGTLRDLNLNDFCVDQILSRYSESSGRDLFDF